MYRSILVAIDGTPNAERALEHARELASALNARLTIMTVVAPVPAFAYRAGIDVVALETEATKESEGFLREAAETAPRELSVETRLRRGHPADEIVAQADEAGHDLIVLGSRGRGRLASTLLGSVAGGVHFHLHAPLLIVHPAEEATD
jgi:nucleotide-binding universal stress UspA family protein